MPEPVTVHNAPRSAPALALLPKSVLSALLKGLEHHLTKGDEGRFQPRHHSGRAELVYELLKRHDKNALLYNMELVRTRVLEAVKDRKAFQTRDWNAAKQICEKFSRKQDVFQFELKVVSNRPPDGYSPGAHRDSVEEIEVHVAPSDAFLADSTKRPEPEWDALDAFTKFRDGFRLYAEGFLAAQAEDRGDPMKGFKDAMYDVLLTPPWVRGHIR